MVRGRAKRDEHHLSASLTERVEAGGATVEPQHRNVLILQLLGINDRAIMDLVEIRSIS
jgi:hypothetical protein